MANTWTRGIPVTSAVALLLWPAALPAQVANYNGVWLLSPPLPYTPLFFAADRMRIVAQPPGILCAFGLQVGTTTVWSGRPLTGSLSTPKMALLSLQTPPSQCTWFYVATLTFVGPDQVAGVLQSTDFYSCFFSGTVTQPFTARRAPLGMYESFAEGCVSPNGPPTLSASSPPSLSAGLTVTLAGIPAGLAFLATGASNTSLGALMLPLALTAQGMPGCDLHVSLDGTSILTGGPTVQVSWTFPSAPSLLGATFYQQALVLAPGANALGARMSNATVGVIGP
ncbi:MAG: hypothetical protein U1E73_10645 [Planctomycetota bacterium]